MSFYLFPATLNYYATYYQKKWDIFAGANQNNYVILSVSPRRPTVPLFKSDSMDDYNRFRSMMQAIDLCALDLSHHQHNLRHLVAACIYIQLGLTFDVFSR